MSLLQRLNHSLPRVGSESPFHESSSAAKPVLATRPPQPVLHEPVVSPWVKNAQSNKTGRSLTGDLPAKEIR
jgi:hypothetical protein